MIAFSLLTNPIAATTTRGPPACAITFACKSGMLRRGIRIERDVMPPLGATESSRQFIAPPCGNPWSRLSN